MIKSIVMHTGIKNGTNARQENIKMFTNEIGVKTGTKLAVYRADYDSIREVARLLQTLFCCAIYN